MFKCITMGDLCFEIRLFLCEVFFKLADYNTWTWKTFVIFTAYTGYI